MIGSRRRILLRGDGERCTLIIRRLRCKDCQKVHHELPNFLVPYKHYAAAVIEAVVEVAADASMVAAAVEDSTQRRWRGWMADLLPYWRAALAALWQRQQTQTVAGLFDRPESRLHCLKHWVGLAPGWLSRIVQSLIHANLWLQTRFALGVRTVPV